MPERPLLPAVDCCLDGTIVWLEAKANKSGAFLVWVVVAAAGGKVGGVYFVH